MAPAGAREAPGRAAPGSGCLRARGSSLGTGERVTCGNLSSDGFPRILISLGSLGISLQKSKT